MLHPYATDSAERKNIPLYLALLAIGSAIVLSWLLAKIHWPGWLDAPATAGLYGLYYELFRRRLWRLQLFRKWGVVKVPDLSGRWDGQVATSFDERTGKHPVHAEIQQDWTHVSVKVKSAYSRSHSVVGSILTDEETVLDYEYINEPLPGAPPTMHVHRGTASFHLSADGRTLSGDYYSGRDRQNFGAIHLNKVE
jgi:hypothetical protein